MRTSILFFVMFVWSVSVSAVEFAVNSREAIVGRVPDLEIDLSSVALNPDSVRVEIQLHGKQVVAHINYKEAYVQIQSISLDNKIPVEINKEDIEKVKLLLESLSLTPSRVADALVSTLNLLSEAPPGLILNIDSKQQKAVEPSQPQQIQPQQAFTSLCNRIGQRVTATYDINFIVVTITIRTGVVVGPCASGGCLGRCGSGCDSTPGSPPAAVQRFTQQCLNHDVCTREVGLDPIGALPPCLNEFVAATPGFFFAPDCAALTGDYTVALRGSTCFEGIGCVEIAHTRVFRFGSEDLSFVGTSQDTRNMVHTYQGIRSGATDISGTWQFPVYKGEDCALEFLGNASGSFAGQNACGRELTMRLAGGWPWYGPGTCAFIGMGDFEGISTATKATAGTLVSTLAFQDYVVYTSQSTHSEIEGIPGSLLPDE